MKAIAVVGSGLEGLLAAYVVSLSNNAVVLFDVKEGTEFDEPFELGLPHDAILTTQIPDMAASVEHSPIQVEIKGDAEKYKSKAWPLVRNNSRLVNIFEDGLIGYDAKEIYERLQSCYEVQDSNRIEANYNFLTQLAADSHIEEVICTLPKSLFCNKIDDEFDPPCVFNKEIGYYSTIPLEIQENPSYVYESTDDRSWHRSGKLFQLQFTEWVAKHPYIETEPFVRPISNNCNCCPDVFFTGRVGKWEGLDVPYDRVLTDVMGIVA